VAKLNYAVEQRMRFIDFLVDHYGYIQRTQLIDYFNISPPQATRDFRQYIELAPDNLVFNVTDKQYKRSGDFERIYP